MHGMRQFIRRRFPILTWLVCDPGYSWRANLAEDLFAGISISVVVIPQSMAYAMLASLPPVYGLYTSLVPTTIYAILGTSRHMSTGTFAITSLLLGQFAHKILSEQGYSESAASDEYHRRYIPLCLVLTFLVGGIQILLSMVRLGRWTSKHVLPVALVSGFNTASAFHIGTHQLKHWLGVKPPRESGVFSMFKTWAWIIDHFWEETSWPTLAMGLAGIILMYILQRIEYCRRTTADLALGVVSPASTLPSPATTLPSPATTLPSPATSLAPAFAVRSPPPASSTLQYKLPHPRTTAHSTVYLRDPPSGSPKRTQSQRRNSTVPKAVSDQALLTVQDVAIERDESCDSCSSSYSPHEGSIRDEEHADLPSLTLPSSSRSHGSTSTLLSYQTPRRPRRGSGSNIKYQASTGLTNTGAFGHHHSSPRQQAHGQRSPPSSQRAHRYNTFRSPTLAQSRHHFPSDASDEQEPLLHAKRFKSPQTSRRASVATMNSAASDDYGSGGYCSTSSNRSIHQAGLTPATHNMVPEQGEPEVTKKPWQSWPLTLSLSSFSSLSSFTVFPKVHFPIPDIFICVVVFTAATVLFDLDTRFGIEAIGYIPTGLPTPAWPPQLVSTWTVSELTPLIWPSFLMAIVVYVMSLSVAKHFGREYEYEVDADQEMLAIGVGSLVGSCFGGYVCTGNLTRSAILAQLNAKTPLASLVGALVVLATLLWFTVLFERVPNTILAAIVLVALKSLMGHTFEARKLWRVGRRKEALIWWITFMAVLVFSIEIGLAVGIATVILLKVYKNAGRWKKALSRAVVQSVWYQRMMLMLGLQSPLFMTGGGLNTGDDDDDY
ncbi:hypothetical protein CPC16_011862 [Podila verticillata]|nr:hypothetical protein CPC16_011862 [Podila verticillata]